MSVSKISHNSYSTTFSCFAPIPDQAKCLTFSPLTAPSPMCAHHPGASFSGYMSQWVHGWVSTLFIDDYGATYIKDFTSNKVGWNLVPLEKKTVSAAIGWRFYWLLLEDGSVVCLDDHDDVRLDESWHATDRVFKARLVQKTKCPASNEDSCEAKIDTDEGVRLTHLSAGDMHVVGCAEDGSAGAVSLPCDDTLTLTWSRFDLPVSVRQVACGKEHVLLLTDSGSVFSYGLGSRGQLGHGSLENCDKPRMVEPLEGLVVTWVAAGGWHSLALSDLGDVYVWGWNESGQLGLPCKTVQEITQNQSRHKSGNQGLSRDPISGSDDWVSIVTEPCVLDLCEDVSVTNACCGSRHSAIVTEQGVLLTTGWNGYGQLGQGDTISRDSFTTVGWFAQRHLVVERVSCGLWSTVVTVSSRDGVT